MALGFIGRLILGVLLNILAYMLMPKPKQKKPPTVEDVDDPVAEAGKPIPVVVGSITVKGLNVLSKHDKEISERETDPDKKK